ESLPIIWLRRFRAVTRGRRRVTRRIGRLAEVFTIVLARNHFGRRNAFLVESLSISRITGVNGVAGMPWIRAWRQSTNKLARPNAREGVTGPSATHTPSTRNNKEAAMQARMRPACLGVAVASILVVFGGGVFAQSNSDIGAWTLNVAKSKYSPGPAPKSATTKIE